MRPTRRTSTYSHRLEADGGVYEVRKDQPPEDFNIRKDSQQPYRQCRAMHGGKLAKDAFEANKEKC